MKIVMHNVEFSKSVHATFAVTSDLERDFDYRPFTSSREGLRVFAN